MHHQGQRLCMTTSLYTGQRTGKGSSMHFGYWTHIHALAFYLFHSEVKLSFTMLCFTTWKIRVNFSSELNNVKKYVCCPETENRK